MSAGIIMFASQYSLKSCHISGFTSACRYPSWIVLLCARMLEASAYVSALSFQSSNSSWLTESHSFSGLRSLATETLLGWSLWCCLCCYLALSHCQFCPEFWKERVPIFVILLPFPVLCLRIFIRHFVGLSRRVARRENVKACTTYIWRESLSQIIQSWVGFFPPACSRCFSQIARTKHFGALAPVKFSNFVEARSSCVLYL